MKLGSLKAGGRDGRLVVISSDLSRVIEAGDIAATLQRALETWDDSAPRLAELQAGLDAGSVEGALACDATEMAAPLPRAY